MKLQVVILISACVATVGFIGWRMHVMRNHAVNHFELVYDPSLSFTGGCESLVGAAEKVLRNPGVSENSTLTVLSVGDPCEGGIVTPKAHAGVQHDGYQEARLPFGEAVIGNRLDAFIPGHSKSSPATSGSNGRLPRRPVRAPTRPPPARYRVNPARALAAACAPR